MLNYVFSEEIYLEKFGKIKGKGAWTFGDRNKTIELTVGDEVKPLDYKNAMIVARREFELQHYPLYKTIYLHSFEPLKKIKKPKRSKNDKTESVEESRNV